MMSFITRIGEALGEGFGELSGVSAGIMRVVQSAGGENPWSEAATELSLLPGDASGRSQPPTNYQIWLAVSNVPKESEREAERQFRTRIRRGTGADQSATAPRV